MTSTQADAMAQVCGQINVRGWEKTLETKGQVVDRDSDQIYICYCTWERNTTEQATSNVVRLTRWLRC